MATMLCPDKLNCDGSDWPITNYTSEGAEPFPPWYSVQFPPDNPPPIDTEYVREGCLFVCRSYVSQQEADLCAQRQAVLCTTPPGSVWYSAPASCSVTCPDGTVFYYTVPAGTFIASSYDEAYRQAQQYACDRAAAERICLSSIPRCACYGVFYSAEISTDSTRSDLVWSVVGTLPIGLNLLSNGATAIIAGTPTVNGTYSFTIVATTPAGNYAARVYTIQVLQITTTFLPDFTVGTPYSYQLAASGGSGNYSWRTAIGTLPDGLTLSSTGLISGTPTGLTTGGALTFEVVDTVCEAANKSFFPPAVSLTTVGTTTIRTKRGWPEYTAGTGALYKTLTVSGYMKQTAATASLDGVGLSDEFCGGAKYTYSGYSQIDNNGNLIIAHTKDLSVACPIQPFPLCRSAILMSNGLIHWMYTDGVTYLLGYCWEDDPGSCPSCSDDEDTWTSIGNYATTQNIDYPTNMIRDDVSNSTVTPTSFVYSGSHTVEYKALFGVDNFPIGTVSPILEIAAWVNLESDGDFTMTLSDEYTDADAEATKVSYTNNSKVTENIPSYRTWTYQYRQNISSRITTVVYTLNFTNLIVGQSYVATVEILNERGIKTLVPYAFTATATTHQIVASAPTPLANKTYTVKKASVAFAA